MQERIFIGIGGVMIGVILSITYVALAPDKEYEALQEKADQLAATLKSRDEALVKSSVKINQVKADKQELESELEGLRKELAQVKDKEEFSGFANAIGKIVESTQDMMYEPKIQKLLVRLNLSPEQEAELRTYYKQQASSIMQVFDGKSPQDLSKTMKSENKFFKELLSKDQYAEYKDLKKSEKDSARQSFAHRELMEMQNLFELSPKQKDKIYTALFDIESAKMSDLEGMGTSDSSVNWNAYTERKYQAKLNALSKFLTPEQLEIYQKNAQASMEARQKLMGQFNHLFPDNTK